jgi:hypothetical protein
MPLAVIVAGPDAEKQAFSRIRSRRPGQRREVHLDMEGIEVAGTDFPSF